VVRGFFLITILDLLKIVDLEFCRSAFFDFALRIDSTPFVLGAMLAGNPRGRIGIAAKPVPIG
jgi:hypothetical protein